MKNPDQAIYDALFTASQGLGYSTFDFLPEVGTAYPFVVISWTMLTPRSTKTKLLGRVSVQVDVYGRKQDRGLISGMADSLMYEFSKIRSTPNGLEWRMVLDESTTRMLKDSSTNEELWHGVLSPVFEFA